MRLPISPHPHKKARLYEISVFLQTVESVFRLHVLVFKMQPEIFI
ncbi:hypothetical protein [Kingella negevensis]|nr:hypothetical protein [Kingella negevensis]WII90436.1 hypothetical protein QEO93_08210 [Kingella negevensis]